MDFATLCLILALVVWAWFHVLELRRRRGKLPPGPYPYPIIGNVLQLGQNPNQSLANLSKTHGPLMSLKLGSMLTVVVSSPEFAKQILQKHDQVFSGRVITSAAEVHNHHKVSVAYLSVGNQWRKLRKICREQMFSNQRLDASQGLRREKLQKLCDYVQECCVGGRAVNIGEAAFTTTLNLMTATLFSVDFTNFGSDNINELKDIMEGVAKVIGTPNLADFFPVLKPFDPQGIRRESDLHIGKLIRMIEVIMNQRLESRGTSAKKNDLLEALLDLDEDELTDEDIKHLLSDLLFAGSDTSASTIEWAMTELLLSPDKLARAKNELRTVIGEDKQVEESDLSKLPYLQAVIKETLRYHPPGPLLVPHKAEDEVTIDGYTIPINTQILINVWAIGRDSSVWPNPNSFEPERFLNSKTDFRGHDFTLIPFGSGRRVCPGLPLADRMLHLIVASLIHNFGWELEAGVEVNRAEKFGLSVHKAVPLMAIPIKM